MNIKRMIFNRKKKLSLNYPKYTAIRLFSWGLMKEFETVVVNEPSLFEPLKFYCINRGFPAYVLFTKFLFKLNSC